MLENNQALIQPARKIEGSGTNTRVHYEVQPKQKAEAELGILEKVV